MLDRYLAQVRLLLSALPEIARETAFALKGGTAINLFYRDLPRLSVRQGRPGASEDRDLSGHAWGGVSGADDDDIRGGD